MAKVSVIVPVYRTEPYLPQCVDSLLAQTLEDIEIILVDDGSPDGSPAICDEYAARDSRIRVIHKENGGVMSALIDGMHVAAGEYVGFVDSDDWVDPGFFQALFDAAQQGADVAVAEVVDHCPGQEPVLYACPVGDYPPPDGGRRMLEDFFLCRYYADDPAPPVKYKCDKLYRRALLTDNEPYFDPALWHGEDVVMNAAILADCARVTLLRGGPKYHYRILAQSASHRFSDDFTQAQMENDMAFQSALTRIAAEKGLDTAPIRFYRGQDLYSRCYAFSAVPEMRLAEKRLYLRRVLKTAPPQALREYARRRKNPLISLYCTLLRCHALTACILLAMVHAALTR